MVLGRDRRAALVAPPGDITAWNVADVARALRRARTAQGLRVDEVGQAAGVTTKDLRALEAATLDHFPDSLSALRAVRRSADYLGLPGDQLALVLMERWPLQVQRGAPSSDPTSVVPVGEPTATTDAVTETAPAIERDQALPTAAVETGRWKGARRQALFGAAAAASGPGTSEVLLEDVRRHGEEGAPPDDEVVDDRIDDGRWSDDGRGVLAGVGAPRRAAPRRGGPRRTVPAGVPEDTPPAWLRVVVVVVVVAVLAGVAGILLHGSGGGSKPPATNASKTNHTTSKKPTVAKVTFQAHQTSPTSADLLVGATSFTVTISAVNYPAWVQVTAPTKSAPVFSGMLYAGQVQTFPVQQSLTVETGSVAGHAAVTVGKAQVGTYVPPAAPFYMTFKSS